MVLSNAERQKRFRERLKAAARGDDLGERVRAALDAALEVVWKLGEAGRDGTFEGYSDLASAKADWSSTKFERHNGPLSDWLRGVFGAYLADASPDDAATLRRALGVLDAISLRDGQRPKKRRRR